MYDFIRIITSIIVCLLIILGLKKIKKLNQTTQIISIVVSLIFYFVISVLPIENLFITFSSSEKLFNYYSKGKYEDGVDGKDSCMIVYSSNTSGGIMFVPKTETGYKIPSFNTHSTINISNINGGVVSTYKANDTNDYYIYIVGYTDNEIDRISLDNGKELSVYKDNSGEKLYFFTYAYVENYNSGSYIMVNNQKINI